MTDGRRGDRRGTRRTAECPPSLRGQSTGCYETSLNLSKLSLKSPRHPWSCSECARRSRQRRIIFLDLSGLDHRTRCGLLQYRLHPAAVVRRTSGPSRWRNRWEDGSWRGAVRTPSARPSRRVLAGSTAEKCGTRRSTMQTNAASKRGGSRCGDGFAPVLITLALIASAVLLVLG
jgi:hypothetical protein